MVWVLLSPPYHLTQALIRAGYTIPALGYRYLLGKSLDIIRHVTSLCCTFLFSWRSRKKCMPMRTHIYRERDYAFGQAIITLRTAIGLTQMALAQFLGVSRGAVLGWEAGSSYPKAEHLKQFIALGVGCQTWPFGREEEEIRALWRASHQKVLLNEPWLSTLLGERPPPLPGGAPEPIDGTRPVDQPVAGSAHARQVDWEDALDVPSFYGRQTELALLWQWVVQERCRVVSVQGLCGIGKSALSVTFMHRVAEHFEVVLFRSLRDAPSCEAWLADCLQVLSPPPGSHLSRSHRACKNASASCLSACGRGGRC